MPKGLRPPYKRGPNGEPTGYTVINPRCLSIAKFIIPGGPCVEVQCTRIGRHRGRTGGHWHTLDLLDEQGKIVRKPNGDPLRIALKWRGQTDGAGIMPHIRIIPYDREKHGTMQDGTFDIDAYLEGRMRE